jgi:expansin (peptidoglycan-binding protein)
VQACDFPKDYPNGNASVTYYTLSMGGGAVNCSFPVTSQNPDVVSTVPFGGGQYFGAMNTADYDNAAVCGACVEVDRTDTGQKVDVMIVDQCPTSSNPKCKAGHIDLSEAAFLQIGTTQEGYLGTGNGGAVGTISWHYIPCPEAGGVSFIVKSGSNQYWAQILVEGHATPVASLSVGGQSATRESYNYWQVGNGNIGPGPYQVSVTDVDGNTIDATIDLSPGAVQQTTEQFPVCK